jgi:hypothetical protein
MTEQERNDIEFEISLRKIDIQHNAKDEREKERHKAVIKALQSELDSDREDREHDEA